MNYTEFLNYIKDNIKNWLPGEYDNAEVLVEQVIKNNDTVLDGLVIKRKESHICPTIYLDGYYEKYIQGYDLSGILQAIARMQVESERSGVFDLSVIRDFEKAKEKIVCRLINADNNQKYLSNKPHTRLGELAVTYHVQIESEVDGVGHVAIDHNLLNNFGVGTAELFEIAVNNMERLTPAVFMPLNTVMERTLRNMGANNGMSEEEIEEFVKEALPDTEGKLYYLGSEDDTYGAIAILNKQNLDLAAKEIGGDFYIFLSSIHETLLMPKDGKTNYEELELMVHDINVTQVAPEEKLSDHVYEYDAKERMLLRCDNAAERKCILEQAEKRAEPKKSLKEALAEKKTEAGLGSKENTKTKATDVSL